MTAPHVFSVRSHVAGRARMRAFTLIELLTVIAIIGILAAIIIPTVGKVRDTARASQCSSNMRQIGLSVMAYANDNKGATPSAFGTGVLYSGQPRSWYLQLVPYFGGNFTAPEQTRKALRMLTCPSSVRSLSGQEDVPWNGFNDANWPHISDFGINWAVNNPSYTSRILTRFDAPRTPSKTPLLAEMVHQNNFIAATFAAARPESDQAAFAAGPGQYQRFTQRHGGGGNILYFDGHVERQSYTNFQAAAGTTAEERLAYVEGRR